MYIRRIFKEYIYIDIIYIKYKIKINTKFDV